MEVKVILCSTLSIQAFELKPSRLRTGIWCSTTCIRAAWVQTSRLRIGLYGAAPLVLEQLCSNLQTKAAAHALKLAVLIGLHKEKNLEL